MNLQPLNGNVLLRQVQAQETTSGGIYLPDTAREQPAEGIIEAVAPGGTDEVAIGDRVLYKKFSGEEIQVEGLKMRLVPEGDLLAKFVQADAIPA
jgi:chaperonin GroES